MSAETTALRARLVELFPMTFYPKGHVKLPLKAGIHKDIVERVPELNVHAVKRALADYTGGPLYLRELTEGRYRWDLDGLPVDHVTKGQARHAAGQLEALEARWAQRDAKSSTTATNKDHTMCGSSSPVSQSAYLPSPEAVDIAPGVLTASGFSDVLKRMIGAGDMAGLVKAIEVRDRANVDHGRSTPKPSTSLIPATSALYPPDGRIEKSVISSELRDILALIPTKKIEAIKKVRALTGLGLKEAKDWVEGLAGAVPVRNSVSITSDPYKPNGFLVLTKSRGASFYEHNEYSYRSDVNSAAQAHLRYSPSDEVIAVEVLGRTKSVFEMLPAA